MPLKSGKRRRRRRKAWPKLRRGSGSRGELSVIESINGNAVSAANQRDFGHPRGRKGRLWKSRLVQAGVFPPPEKQPNTGRPFYREESQEVCLEVRRRNCGINGQPGLFYARRLGATLARPRAPKPKLESKGKDVSALIDGLNALGLTTGTAAQVQRVTEELFPQGTAGLEPGRGSAGRVPVPEAPDFGGKVRRGLTANAKSRREESLFASQDFTLG